MTPPDGQDDESVGIDAPVRAYIHDLFTKLSTLSHYELLGVARDADKKAIKRAYFGLAGTLHPDRFYGKKLGSYGPKLQAIVARLSDAYETLSNAERRATYDASRAERPSDPTLARTPVSPKVAKERSDAMNALRQRFVEGKAKAKELADAAERARAAGDASACAAAYKAALGFAPGDAALQAAYREAQREADQRLVESHRKKALLAERWGRWDDAAQSWRRVLEANPGDAEATLGLAKAASPVKPPPKG
jgi:curved DNA-binding protein CbpA